MSAITGLQNLSESGQDQPDTAKSTPSAAVTKSLSDCEAAPGARCKLSVLSGIQKGAVACLPNNKTIHLGRSLENDIVLRDQGVAAVHATIQFKGAVPVVTAIGDSLIADGLQIDEGQMLDLDQAGMIQLGNVGISIESRSALGECTARDSADDHHQQEHCKNLSHSPGSVSQQEQTGLDKFGQTQPAFFTSTADDLPVALNRDSAQAAAKPEESLKSGSGAAGMKTAAMTLTVLVLGALVVWQSGLFQQQPEEKVDLQSALAASPFAALVLVQTDQNATINGFLDTKQEFRQLDQWLDETGLVVINDVVVGEILAERVHDVFRVHGIEADVQVNDGGHVVVATQVADADLLASVDERVMADVPAIAGLTINNTPQAPVNEAETATVLDAGKRVVSVAPDYIVTEDRSRYFVGSILPTGHRIASIENGTVLLEKDAVTTTLDF